MTKRVAVNRASANDAEELYIGHPAQIEYGTHIRKQWSLESNIKTCTKISQEQATADNWQDHDEDTLTINSGFSTDKRSVSSSASTPAQTPLIPRAASRVMDTDTLKKSVTLNKLWSGIFNTRARRASRQAAVARKPDYNENALTIHEENQYQLPKPCDSKLSELTESIPSTSSTPNQKVRNIHSTSPHGSGQSTANMPDKEHIAQLSMRAQTLKSLMDNMNLSLRALNFDEKDIIIRGISALEKNVEDLHASLNKHQHVELYARPNWPSKNADPLEGVSNIEIASTANLSNDTKAAPQKSASLLCEAQLLQVTRANEIAQDTQEDGCLLQTVLSVCSACRALLHKGSALPLEDMQEFSKLLTVVNEIIEAEHRNIRAQSELLLAIKTSSAYMAKLSSLPSEPQITPFVRAGTSTYAALTNNAQAIVGIVQKASGTNLMPDPKKQFLQPTAAGCLEGSHQQPKHLHNSIRPPSRIQSSVMDMAMLSASLPRAAHLINIDSDTCATLMQNADAVIDIVKGAGKKSLALYLKKQLPRAQGEESDEALLQRIIKIVSTAHKELMHDGNALSPTVVGNIDKITAEVVRIIDEAYKKIYMQPHYSCNPKPAHDDSLDNHHAYNQTNALLMPHLAASTDPNISMHALPAAGFVRTIKEQYKKAYSGNAKPIHGAYLGSSDMENHQADASLTKSMRSVPPESCRTHSQTNVPFNQQPTAPSASPNTSMHIQSVSCSSAAQLVRT